MPAKIPPIPNYEVLGLDPKVHPKVWEAINKGWQPGRPGKGLIENGELYSWNTDGTFPNHTRAIEVLGGSPSDFLFIEPDGTFRHEAPEHDSPVEDIVAQDPRLKPIGPDTTWGFGKVAKRLEWQPGKKGKGIADAEGNIHTWQTDRFDGPHHDEVIQDLGLHRGPFPHTFEIDPMGQWDSWTHTPELKSILQTHRPDLTYAGDKRYDVFNDGWNFAASVDENNHHLDWEAGNDGKGMLFNDGSIHTWNSDDYEVHDDYLADHPELDAGEAHYLYIEPHGKVSTAWGTLLPEHEEQLREADPRLHVDLDHGNGVNWAFGA